MKLRTIKVEIRNIYTETITIYTHKRQNNNIYTLQLHWLVAAFLENTYMSIDINEK